MSRPLLIGALALVASGAISIAWLLPPRALPAASAAFTLTWPVVRGAYHVHSQRSDGTGTIDEIAAAAAVAGLQFVILTDHGDGTRPPEPPRYRSGVLCLDAVEISTRQGHIVAIDLPPSPYPLGGSARAVIEDVQRAGGVAFVAHPGSPKPDLQWRDWSAPFDGLEWLNADSEWRDEFWGSLGAMLLTYPLRPVETLSSMLDRPVDVIARWEQLTRERRVPVLAGADAHARLGYRQSVDPYQDNVIARVPSYSVSFGAFVNHVILSRPLTGDAAIDAQLLTDAIREGHAFTSVDGLAVLGAFEAKATSGSAAATPGAYLDLTAPAAIEAVIAAPRGTSLSVVRDGETIYETTESALRLDVGSDAGVYRIEARLPTQRRSSIAWLFSNPIYIGMRDAHARAAEAPVPPAGSSRRPIATELWQAEASEGSTSTLEAVTLEDGTPAVQWSYTIAEGVRGEQYAAVRFPVTLRIQERLQLRARSDRPTRLWAQLRTATPGGAERWGESFYVSPSLEPIELRVDEFRPFVAASAERPPLDRVDSLLLVIDTVNSAPGSSGRIAITDLWLAR